MEKERRNNVTNFLKKSIEVFKNTYILYFKFEINTSLVVSTNYIFYIKIYLNLTKNG